MVIIGLTHIFSTQLRRFLVNYFLTEFPHTSATSQACEQFPLPPTGSSKQLIKDFRTTYNDLALARLDPLKELRACISGIRLVFLEYFISNIGVDYCAHTSSSEESHRLVNEELAIAGGRVLQITQIIQVDGVKVYFKSTSLEVHNRDVLWLQPQDLVSHSHT